MNNVHNSILEFLFQSPRSSRAEQGPRTETSAPWPSWTTRCIQFSTKYLPPSARPGNDHHSLYRYCQCGHKKTNHNAAHLTTVNALHSYCPHFFTMTDISYKLTEIRDLSHFKLVLIFNNKPSG